jgi:hypothetical protein
VKSVSAKGEMSSERAVASGSMLAVVQPVNAGTTGTDDPVVVVVGSGSGPVNATTNVSGANPAYE